MGQKERVIYYKDEKNDDFSGLDINVKPLDENYKYIRTHPLFKAFEFVFYHAVMIPVVYMLQKVYNHQRFANRKVMKDARKSGCFIVSNHTQVQSDSYIGPLAMWPNKCFIISNPHVLSVKIMRLGMQAYGVIPLGSNYREKKEFLHCVAKRMSEGKSVIVYPEAHVWPYYTGIRRFDDQCFCYLVKQKKPMYVLTNCYQKRRFFKKPRIVTYADGPFYPDRELSQRAAARQMCDVAYKTLCKRTRDHSTYEYIKYVKEE